MKKVKILNRICFVLNIILSAVLIIIYIFLVNGFIEKGIVSKEINNFKERGEFTEQVIINMQKVNMYKVVKKYDYEDTSRPIYTFDFERQLYYLGSKTDITITSRNPMRFSDSVLIKDVCAFFANNFYLGHATINVTEDGSYYVESIGNNVTNKVEKNLNTWIDTEIRGADTTNKIVGLRLKNTTSEIRDKICESALNKVGSNYTFNFFIPPKDEYYCTNLISRTLDEHGIKINYDNCFAIGNDFIVSDETYLIFYIECDSDGIFSFYYLSEE